MSQKNNPKETSTPLLEMIGIDKSFPGVHAIKSVDLNLYSGEVLALVGENGAGKSTLMKILGGAYIQDSGVILINGQEVNINNPIDAQRVGVAMIYQEFNLVPFLSARENIFLGRENTKGGFIRSGEEYKHAKELFLRIGIGIDPEEICDQLTVAQKQIVEIAKALSVEARIFVMDEPSATLSSQEVEKLFEIIYDLKSQGIGVIYISHRIEEIFYVADRVMVMRDGERVDTRSINQVNKQEIIEMMVGRKIENEFPERKRSIGPERLIIRNLSRGLAVKNVSFSIHEGEVLGMTGLVGAGRTETARLIFGADQLDSGTILLDGENLNIHSPRDAIDNGIGLLTEDRQGEGLILDHTARENFSLPNLLKLSNLGFVKQKDERKAFGKYIDNLKIKIPYQDQYIRNLSGGNQQKVVLAKWLHQNSEVIIFDEPTRGIDVGTKYEIYLLINELASQGKAILMISSELPEVLGMSDRILIMHEGRITGEIKDVPNTTQEQILKLAIG